MSDFELPSPGPIIGGYRVKSELDKVFISLRIHKDNVGEAPTGYHEFLEFLQGSLEKIGKVFPPPEAPKPRKGAKQ